MPKNEHFGANWCRDRNPVMLRKLQTNPSKFGFLLLVVNIPYSLPKTAMTAQREKESHRMHLIDLERDTNFTLQNQAALKSQKLVLCL